MHPFFSCQQTLFTPIGAGRYCASLINVRAFLRHDHSRFIGVSLQIISCCLTAASESSVYLKIPYNGTITISGYIGPGGSVNIPNLINGLPVTSIGSNAFRHQSSWLPCALGLCLGLHLPLAREIFGHAANHGRLRKCAIPLTRFRFTF